MTLDLLDETKQGLDRFIISLDGGLGFSWQANAYPWPFWARYWFMLREAEDRPEWFPSGKWATLQAIESVLCQEARMELTL
jgi:hypothetical protein